MVWSVHGAHERFVAELVVLAPCPKNPDINGDGFVNGVDITYLLNSWGACPASTGARRLL